MPRLSHSSFLSSPDENGYRHTLSIDWVKSYKNHLSATYEAKVRSTEWHKDPRDGSIVNATFFKNKNGESSEFLVDREVKKTEISQNVAIKFNCWRRHVINTKNAKENKWHSGDEKENRDVRIQMLQTAQLDEVSSFDWSRVKNEFFFFQDMFCRFENFLCSAESIDKPLKRSKSEKHAKKTKPCHFYSLNHIDEVNHRAFVRNRCGSEGDASNSPGVRPPGQTFTLCHERAKRCKSTKKCVTNSTHPSLNEFVHYFFFSHQGTMAIDCLKGEYDEQNGYTLTVPVIHSREMQFGFHDQGFRGIKRVIQNHVCTSVCKLLPPMTMNPTTRYSSSAYDNKMSYYDYSFEGIPLCACSLKTPNCPTMTLEPTNHLYSQLRLER